MSDPATLSFALTYTGTLAVAALIAWILTLPVYTLIRRADK